MRPQSLRNEDGFTLVEMIVAIPLSMLVLFATLYSLDTFATNTARQTRASDANDQVRATMDRVVGDLRDSSKILLASATDLVYAVPDTAGTRVERLCVASGDLYHSSSITAGTPAVPVAACASGSKVASLKSTASTAFTYDGATSSASPGLVKNVGLTFSLDASTNGKTTNSTLQASAARRSAGTLPITGGDFHATCTGNSGALLSLAATVPGVAGLNVTYATSGGVSLGAGTGAAGVSVTVPAGLTTLVATVTDALGVTNTISRSVQC